MFRRVEAHQGLNLEHQRRFKDTFATVWGEWSVPGNELQVLTRELDLLTRAHEAQKRARERLKAPIRTTWRVTTRVDSAFRRSGP